jgi:hypothetical protein
VIFAVKIRETRVLSMSARLYLKHSEGQQDDDAFAEVLKPLYWSCT